MKKHQTMQEYIYIATRINTMCTPRSNQGANDRTSCFNQVSTQTDLFLFFFKSHSMHLTRYASHPSQVNHTGKIDVAYFKLKHHILPLNLS